MMAGINYASMAATAKRLIEANGTKFDASRPAQASRDENGVEVITPGAAFSAAGVITKWSLAEQIGGIQAGEIKMVVIAEAAVENGDVFTAKDGKRYRIVDSNPVQPAGTLLLFMPRMVQI